MTKHKVVLTDTIFVGDELKHAGAEVEVTGEAHFKQLLKRGHFEAGTTEAEAFLKKGGKKRPAHANKMLEPPVNKAVETKDLHKMNLPELQARAVELEIATVDDNGHALTKKQLVTAIEDKEVEDLA